MHYSLGLLFTIELGAQRFSAIDTACAANLRGMSGVFNSYASQLWLELHYVVTFNVIIDYLTEIAQTEILRSENSVR